MKEAVAEVIRSVAKAYGVKPSDLTGESRQRRIVQARQVSMYVLRHSYGMVIEDVAVALGRTAHTTAMHACRSVEAKMDGDKLFAKMIERFCVEAASAADRRGLVRESQDQDSAE